MKRPRAFQPPRSIRFANGPVIERTKAAVELVRVEYHRARLEREIDTFCARAEAAMRELERIDARGRLLNGFLTDDVAPAPPKKETPPPARPARKRWRS